MQSLSLTNWHQGYRYCLGIMIIDCCINHNPDITRKETLKPQIRSQTWGDCKRIQYTVFLHLNPLNSFYSGPGKLSFLKIYQKIEDVLLNESSMSFGHGPPEKIWCTLGLVPCPHAQMWHRVSEMRHWVWCHMQYHSEHIKINGSEIKMSELKQFCMCDWRGAWGVMRHLVPNPTGIEVDQMHLHLISHHLYEINWFNWLIDLRKISFVGGGRAWISQ